MADPRSRLQDARRVVIKVGSALLAETETDPFLRIGDALGRLRESGRDVVLVSSGAIALGLPRLGFDQRPADLASLQAAAAAGQGQLIARWASALAKHDIEVAQVLLTHSDLSHRRRYLNAKHALEKLLERGALPIVNENDTVSVDEIKLGDNDSLAAEVCGLISADLVVLLTGADGLFDKDPRTDQSASRVSVVDVVDDRIRAMAGPPAAFGTGGMHTKLDAAQVARAHGAATVIAPGQTPDILERVMAGDDVGTLFLPSGETPQKARKRWIQNTLRPAGTIVVDDGAVRALKKGASLLFAGVREVRGDFLEGDAVDVVGADDVVIGRGLSALSAADARTVAGQRTDAARAAFGGPLPDELIHRDDLVLLEAPPAAGRK